MRIPLIIAILFELAVCGFAQTPAGNFLTNNLKGKIKSITHERTYLIIGGQNAGEQTSLIRFDEYDEGANLIRTSAYGNIEQRILIDRTGGRIKLQVLYFDSKGKPLPSGDAEFEPPTGKESQQGLCTDYEVRSETDPIAKIDREFETCSDGTLRSSTTWEYDHSDRLIRKTRVDSKGRSWEHVCKYDLNDLSVEFTYTADNKVLPKYSQRVEYRNQKFDDKGNIISEYVTSFNSLRPGQIEYQYVELYKITYF